MFKKLRQRLAGVLTFEDMARRSEQYIEQAMNSEEEKSRDIAISQFDRNPQWFEAWLQDHHEILKRAAQSSRRHDQVINLRQELVNLIESSLAAQTFLSDEFAEENKRLLAGKLHPDMEFNDVMSMEFQLYVFSEASSGCLRLISLELRDARKNDWFVLYCDIYKHFIEHLYKEMIAQARGDVYALGPLVPVAKAAVDEAKKKILQGFNWDYDKEAREQEIQERAAIEKTKQPPKQRLATSHQIERLVEFQVERVRRMQHGEIYNVEGYQPINPLNFITVDTGLMLIGLSECLEDRDTAVRAMGEIMWRTVNKIAPDAMQGKTEEDISLADQIVLLTMWEENREKGPLAGICLLAAHLLFDIETRQGDKEHSQMVGEIGAKLIDDAWEVIATTKNVFGWNLKTRIS